MTHPTRRFTPPPCSPDALALDRALDAWVRGDATALDALDPEMEATVAQLYAWADAGGVPQEPVVVEASRAVPSHTTTPRTPRPLAFAGDADPSGHRSSRTLSRRTRIMTAFSGLAAALVLGLSIYGAVPLITDRDQASGPVLTLEAPSSLAASGDANQTPTPLQAGDTTPPTDFVIAPLTASDCPTQARTRDEVLAVLSTPSAPGSDLYVGNTSVDQSTLDAVNGTLRGWWACMLFGKPWNAMALESDQYLRELFYGNSQVSKAFSPSTLNELLDAREEASDARLLFGPVVGADMLMVLDVSNAVITPDQVPVRSVEADVFWVSPYTGEISNQSSLLFEFVWEDGAWKIRAINNFNGPPFPATR